MTKMNPLDKIMTEQLRKISEEYDLSSVGTIADRMQQLAEMDWKAGEMKRFLHMKGLHE